MGAPLIPYLLPTRRITLNKLVGLIAILLLSAGFWRWWLYSNGELMISDAKLISQFHSYRADFERLHQMAVDDNLQGRIGMDFNDDKNLRRVDEYRRLMKNSGIQMMVKGGNGEMYFWVDLDGSVIAGRSKGVAYFPQLPHSPILPSLDKSCLPLVGPNASSCDAVLQVDGSWWLIRVEDR